MVKHFQGVLPVIDKYENNKRCICNPMVVHVQGVPSVTMVNILWQQIFHLPPTPKPKPHPQYKKYIFTNFPCHCTTIMSN